MNKFLFFFQSWKKVTKIMVGYSLITTSGNTIYEVEEFFDPSKPTFKIAGDFDLWEWRKEVEKEYIEILDKRTLEVLNKFKENERKKIKKGWLDSGNYIVKCVWDFDMETDWLSYNEYIKLASNKQEIKK